MNTAHRVRFAMAALALAGSGAALAHPGHPDAAGFLAGLSHPFMGADHLLAMVAVGAWAAMFAGRIVWAVPLAFVAAVILGAVLGLSGIAPSLREFFIASSVLALGLGIALRVRVSLALAPLIAVFGVFHGLAHGAEFQSGPVSTAGSAAAYFPAFVLATASLHALGVGLGAFLRGGPLRARLAGAPVAAAGALMVLQAISV